MLGASRPGNYAAEGGLHGGCPDRVAGSQGTSGRSRLSVWQAALAQPAVPQPCLLTSCSRQQAVSHQPYKDDPQAKNENSCNLA